MKDDLFVFNGVDATTGGYLLELSVKEIAKVARGERIDPAHQQELKNRYERLKYQTLAPLEGVDPNNLAESGWGVIFSHDAEPALRDALRPLLEHRKSQAGARYREFWGEDAYRPGESKTEFLVRHGHGPFTVDPDRVPYYLLLVGDPEAIPYRFQYLLDVQFAIGRIHFDTVEEYAHYAESVVRAEKNTAPPLRRAAFFGVHNSDDQATYMSTNELVTPLAAKIAQCHKDWEFIAEIGAGAVKARLSDFLGGKDTPSLFFSASHGMGFPYKHALQRAHQGALLCQDWMGPVQHHGPIARESYFAGDDIADDANLSGMIAFFFACYSCGTPQLDDFSHQSLTQPKPIAEKAFVAALPQRMLCQPAGGALAVIGHVERAWGYSFSWPGVGAQNQDFQSALERLLKGMTVGHALEFFNIRYAELSTMLSIEIENAKFAAQPDEWLIANLWTTLNDARSYVIIGDPAVRLVSHPPGAM